MNPGKSKQIQPNPTKVVLRETKKARRLLGGGRNRESLKPVRAAPG